MNVLLQEIRRHRRISCQTATYPHVHKQRLVLHRAVAYLEEYSL